MNLFLTIARKCFLCYLVISSLACTKVVIEEKIIPGSSAPDLFVDAPTQNSTQGLGSINIRGRANGAKPISAIYASINSTNIAVAGTADWSFNFNSLLFGIGTHKINIYASDIDNVHSYSFTLILNIVPSAAVLANVPASSTNSTSINITVGGLNIVSYKFNLDATGFSSERSITNNIIATSLSATNHNLQVLAKDSYGNWQITATVVNWLVDLTAPTANVLNLTQGQTNVFTDKIIAIDFSSDINKNNISNSIEIFDGLNVVSSNKIWKQNRLFLKPSALAQSSTNSLRFSVLPKDSAGNALLWSDVVFQTGTSLSTKYVDAGTNDLRIYFTDPGMSPFSARTVPLQTDVTSLLNSCTSSIDMAMAFFNVSSLANVLISQHNNPSIAVRFAGNSNGEISWSSNSSYQLLANASVPMSLRNNLSVGEPYGLMHQKSFVCDASTTFTGSTNFTDNGLNRNNNNAIIINSLPLASGYLDDFNQMFLGDFANTKIASSTTSTLVNGYTIEYYFSPKDNIAQIILDKLSTANTSVHFLSYSITRSDLAKKLISLHNSAVSVQGIMDKYQSANSYSKASTLIAAGVNVHYDGNENVSTYGGGGGAMHHKIILIDADSNSDPMVITGSMNFSTSGNSNNDEAVIVIHSKEVSRFYYQEFDKLWWYSDAP